MRCFLIAVALAACGVDTSAMPQPVGGDSFDQPIEAACDAMQAQLCDGGFAYCTHSICRAFCAVVDVGSRCEGIGGVEHHELGWQNADVCTCW